MRQETSRIPPRAPLFGPAAAALYAIAVLVLSAAAVRAVVTAHAERLWNATGNAEWIWCASPRAEARPIRFFATRDVLLPRPPGRATAKLFVDRGHVLYVNGVAVGRGTQAPGDALRVYRLDEFLRLGTNRIAVEASSPTGIGGILFSLDLDSHGRDAVVSNGLWRVDYADTAVTAGGRYRPTVWGRPPQYPWGYPRLPRPEEVIGGQ